MQQKIEICQQCFFNKPVNSKHLCPDCVFKNNHNGKSQFEVYNERANLNQSIKTKEIYISEIKLLKSPKKRIKQDEGKLERKKEILRKDEELYEYIFNNFPHRCQECGCRLPDKFRDGEGNIIYRAQYSHILSKGSSPEFRHEKVNINRLCFGCHQKWEFSDQTKMKVYELNQLIIQELYDQKNKV